MYKQLKKMRQEEGFTLIELLLVIIILGVLAAIVVFSVNGINDTSKKSACESDYKNVEIAVEAYSAQDANHLYPTAISGGATTLTGSNLLKEAPATGNGYTITYTQLGGGANYTLTATGACTLPAP